MTGRRGDYLACARITAELIRSSLVVAAWDRESALPKLTVGGLAGHLAYQVLPVPDLLSSPRPAEPVVSVLGHYERVRWIGAPVDDPFNVGVRDTGSRLAMDGAVALADRLDAAVDQLSGALADAPDRPVHLPIWDDWSLTLDDLLLTRTLELVVHLDDLAVSVAAATPAVPPTAADAVACLLAALAVRRHGLEAVVRAFARRERAPATIAAF